MSETSSEPRPPRQTRRKLDRIQEREHRLWTIHRKALDAYRAALPEAEFNALCAWLTTFYPFQVDWLLDPAKLAICNKSRQIGMSHTTAAVGVLWGAFHGELTTIISIGERESLEVLEHAKRHAKVLQALGSKMTLFKRQTADELMFASGGRIMALPASGGRGFSGNAFLDEYAYQEHAAKTWDAVSAATTLGYRIRVSSTPNGVGNEFHQLWKRSRQDDSRWSPHEVSMELARSQGYPVDDADCWERAKGDPRLYSQLYGCKFLDGELQYITGDLIEDASTDDLATADGAYFAGLDIGKTVDRTVLYVLRKTGGAYVTAYLETHKRTDDEGLDNMVDRAFKRFDLRRLALDATGLGAFPAQRMQKKFGISKVEPITFTLQTKEDLATGLYTAFSKRQIKIPKTRLLGVVDGKVADLCPRKEVEQLREDIASLRRIITSAGNVRYDAPHTDEGHADRAWALALALHAAMNAPTYARM